MSAHTAYGHLEQSHSSQVPPKPNYKHHIDIDSNHKKTNLVSKFSKNLFGKEKK